MNRAVAWLFLVACTPEPTVATEDEIESACVEGDTVHVKFVGCLSSSCDTLTEVSCTATLTGTNADVVGEATIESVGNECTADCGLIEADCALPAGAATISVGGGAQTAVGDAVCEAL